MPDLRRSALGSQLVASILDLARRHLDMDVAYVAAFQDGRQVLTALNGDAAAFGMSLAGEDVQRGFAADVVLGDMPSVIPDARSAPYVRDLDLVAEYGIGSYVGVPLTMREGAAYGSLCCVSREPRPDLGLRDVRFLALLAELLIDDVSLQHDVDQQWHLVDRLLALDEVAIALQPIVDLRSGRCVGVESLSRFPAGFGPPDVVFAAAHAAGRGTELEQLAVRSAFTLLPTLRDPIYVGLNLGPAVAMDLTAALPADVDIPWQRLVLEITEHAAVEDYAGLRRALQPFRDRGLRVAVDDAGAGYASMQHVVEMRPDIIKVDRTLVDGLASDPARRSVVSAFVLLAFELGATVLAEGVETREDLEAAMRLGASTAQGYVIARPSVDPADHRRWGGAHSLLADVGLGDIKG